MTSAPRRLLLTLAIALMSTAACGGGRAVTTGKASLDGFAAAMRVTASDYEPMKSPAALRRQADVVVAGTIVAVSPGPSYAPAKNEAAYVSTSILRVDVDRVIAGSESIVHEGSVYIEVQHPAFVGGEAEPLAEYDREAFARTVPRSNGVFFLDDTTDEPLWEFIFDEGAGRPEGSRVTATFVQGFIEDSAGRLVSIGEPLENQSGVWPDLKSLAEVEAAALD